MRTEAAALITGDYTIGVPVAGQVRALAFHVDTLGLEKRVDMPLEQFGGRWIEVAPPGAPVSVALVPQRDGVPGGVETGIRSTTRRRTNAADARPSTSTAYTHGIHSRR